MRKISATPVQMAESATLTMMPPKMRPNAIWPVSVFALKWWREKYSATSAMSATAARTALLPVNKLQAAPVLSRWTRSKKPGMTILSWNSGMVFSTSHLVNWSSARMKTASEAMRRFGFEKMVWAADIVTSFKFQVSSFKPERRPKSAERQLWTLDFGRE